MRLNLQHYMDVINQIPEGIYFIKPSRFNCLDDYGEYLFDKIVKNENGWANLKEIEEFVLKSKLTKALILTICSTSDYNLEFDRSTILESALIKLIQKFNMKEAYGLIDYQAKQLAANIYAKKIKYYIAKKMLPMRIINRINITFERNLQKYSKSLPFDFTNSGVEDFICAFIFHREFLLWDDFSAEDIIQTWISYISASEFTENVF